MLLSINLSDMLLNETGFSLCNGFPFMQKSLLYGDFRSYTQTVISEKTKRNVCGSQQEENN
jgi:hypothetical protein